MREDSSIDPAGTQQPQAPYASGLTQSRAPQAAGTGPDATANSVPVTGTPGNATGGGPGMTDPARDDADARAAAAETPATSADPALEPADAQPAGGQSADAQPADGQPADGQPAAGQAAGGQAAGQDSGIWDAARADEFRHRWHDVQTHFVEDPRGSVTEARQLVDEAVQSLADSVHEREEQLEHAGARASDSTEGMRDTVLQYHHLLDRLLAV